MTDPLNALAAHASDARRMLAQDKDPSRVIVAALAEGVPALVAELDEVRAEARRLLEYQAAWVDLSRRLAEAVGDARPDAPTFVSLRPAIAGDRLTRLIAARDTALTALERVRGSADEWWSLYDTQLKRNEALTAQIAAIVASYSGDHAARDCSVLSDLRALKAEGQAAAAAASQAAIATDKPPRCSQCGRDLAAPACGPTHALAAHQSGVEPRTFAEDEAAQADRCRYCGHGVSLHVGRWCREPRGAVNAAGAQLLCCCEGSDAGAQESRRGGAS